MSAFPRLIISMFKYLRTFALESAHDALQCSLFVAVFFINFDIESCLPVTALVDAERAAGRQRSALYRTMGAPDDVYLGMVLRQAL